MEWSYAFDIHCNASFYFLWLTSVFQYLLLPVLLGPYTHSFGCLYQIKGAHRQFMLHRLSNQGPSMFPDSHSIGLSQTCAPKFLAAPKCDTKERLPRVFFLCPLSLLQGGRSCARRCRTCCTLWPSSATSTSHTSDTEVRIQSLYTTELDALVEDLLSRMCSCCHTCNKKKT